MTRKGVFFVVSLQKVRERYSFIVGYDQFELFPPVAYFHRPSGWHMAFIISSIILTCLTLKKTSEVTVN